VAAFTTMLQRHLPPVDTINAVFKLESGVSGTFQQSVGTSLTGAEWTIGCEHGVVTVADSKVTITANGGTETKMIPDERTGVPPEIRAWGQALVAGKVLREQEPEEALADLELVSLKIVLVPHSWLMTDSYFLRLSSCFGVERTKDCLWLVNIKASKSVDFDGSGLCIFASWTK
jgi:hypothetical protein